MAAWSKEPVVGPFITVNTTSSFNLKDMKTTPTWSRILLMGDSGTGKTHFLGTMPKPFVADFDNGVTTLAGKDVGATIYSPSEWQKFKTLVEIWRKSGPQEEYQTFCLDSLTMAADAAMRYVLEKNGRLTGQPTIADWGEAIREVKDMMGFLTTLKCHVVVTSHSQLVKDELLGDIQWVPLIFGKDLPHRLGIWFDEVYLTTIVNSIAGGQKTNEYRLQVKPDSRVRMLKSRMNTDGKLFDTYETPDFAALRAKTTKPST